MTASLRTRVTDLVGIDVPIVQTGMGWVSDARLTAATSAAGGLGILSAALLSYDELAAAITAIKAATDKPFGVNVRADQADVVERIDLMISAGVKVASFALAPKADLIKRCKDGGLVVIPSIGAARHAEKVASWGADAVIVQGGEGGGHTGPVPTTLLLPSVVDAVDIPVIAAGGFFDGRGLVAALAFGAEAVAMGTRFLLTQESPVADAVKAVYLGASLTDTVVTTQVDGVPQRVLRRGTIAELEGASTVGRVLRAGRNALAFRKLTGTPLPEMMREGMALHHGQDRTWSQVVMAANAPMLYKAALHDGRADLGVMATGQVVGMIDDIPTVAELITRIMAQASTALERLPR